MKGNDREPIAAGQHWYERCFMKFIVLVIAVVSFLLGFLAFWLNQGPVCQILGGIAFLAGIISICTAIVVGEIEVVVNIARASAEDNWNVNHAIWQHLKFPEAKIAPPIRRGETD